MAIDAPSVSFLDDDTFQWTADDLAVLDPDWAGTGEVVANRVWNFAAYDADDSQVLYQQHITATHITVDWDAWYRVEVTAVEVTSVGGTPPEPPILEFGEESLTSFQLQAGPIDPSPVDPTITIGGYVRHRDRMVQQSVFEDLRDTLIACRWLAGTTKHEVVNPENGDWEIVTTAPQDVLPLLESPIELIDYFPDDEDDDSGVVGETVLNKMADNTFALDNGVTGDPGPRELGSRAQWVPYTFNVAFWATSDAGALAVLNDLRDRYVGRLVRDDTIALWNFNTSDSVPVVRMDVEKFTYRLNTELATPPEVHLYFGELLILDEVD